ncbi:MAG TPA: hypothetical protein VD931_20785 [Baekduia sp.]|nr:hypothetical protein [Baekduia sp.]
MLLIAGALAALLAPPAARAQPPAGDPLLVPLARATPADEYDGYVLFSRFDGERYNLSVWRNGEVRDLLVRSQREAFDADLGPDSSGRPSAVVSLCDGSCDLFVIGLDVGDRLRPVRNANTRGSDEVAPSVWRGRLVFGRRYGRHQVVPYTKRLQWPRSRPSVRLAALPRRRCGAVDPPDCRRIEDVTLHGQELWGRWVAQHWTYQPDAFPGFRQNEIRLTNVGRSDTRQVASMGTGIGGQTYLGPSIAAGRVAFFRACHADRGGCSTRDSGAIRYRIATGAYGLDGARDGWSGWAWSGQEAYYVPADDACAGGDPGIQHQACGLYRRSEPQFSPVSESRIR